MDRETANWLAELIQQATSELEYNPGLTVEVETDATKWLQVLPEEDEETAELLGGYVLNFPYRNHSGDPLLAMQSVGLSLPPDTRALEWEDNGHAMVWIRPDIPLVALALFIGDILTKITGAPDDSEFTVQIEYGF